jgi:hypothetical protein
MGFPELRASNTILQNFSNAERAGRFKEPAAREAAIAQIVAFAGHIDRDEISSVSDRYSHLFGTTSVGSPILDSIRSEFPTKPDMKVWNARIDSLEQENQRSKALGDLLSKLIETREAQGFVSNLSFGDLFVGWSILDDE